MEKQWLIAMALFALAVLLTGYGVIRAHALEHAHGPGHSHKHSGFAHKHDGSVFSIDYYAYASRIRSWNPGFKAVLAISCLIICIASGNLYISFTLIYLMGFIVIVFGGLPLNRYLSLMTIPIVFMIFGSLAIAIGVARGPAGQYNLNLGLFYIYASNESILKTLKLIAKAFGCVSAMYMLTLTTPAAEIITVLRSIHVPDLLIELMNMIYRYIFILMDTQCRMKNSAVSRLGYVDYKTSVYSFGMVAGNLLVVSLKKGNAYYQALESRCYDGSLRFLEEDKPVTKKQKTLGLLLLIFLILLWIITGSL